MKGDRLGELEELILLSLRMIGADASSLGIQQALEREADRPLSLGAIYAALDRLGGKGFVDSRLGDPTPVRGGRRKRFYALTDAGLEALVAKRRLRRALWEKAADLSLDPEAAR
jgi:DNA-binding PadR family transcriptional regulator